MTALADAHACEGGACGGVFLCPGCVRQVGWCRGASDELPDHCDDCAEQVLAALDAAPPGVRRSDN